MVESLESLVRFMRLYVGEALGGLCRVKVRFLFVDEGSSFSVYMINE